MNIYNDLYSFVGWFICVRAKNEKIITYVQVNKNDFLHVIDEAKVFCKKLSTVINCRLVKDRDWVHMDYLVDDFLIGYAEFMKFDDFFRGDLMSKSLYDIGTGWIFNVKLNDDFQLILDEICKSKYHAILISDCIDLPFTVGSMTVILYRVYSRSAYDLYHKLRGEHIRVCDPVIIQGILNSVSSDEKITVLQPLYGVKYKY